MHNIPTGLFRGLAYLVFLHLPWPQEARPKWEVGNLCFMPIWSDQTALLPSHPGDCFWRMFLLWVSQATTLQELSSPCLQLFCSHAFWEARNSLDVLQWEQDFSHLHSLHAMRVTTHTSQRLWRQCKRCPYWCCLCMLCTGRRRKVQCQRDCSSHAQTHTTDVWTALSCLAKWIHWKQYHLPPLLVILSGDQMLCIW